MGSIMTYDTPIRPLGRISQASVSRYSRIEIDFPQTNAEAQ